MIIPDINSLIHAYGIIAPGIAGDLTPDAHLAALAIEYQAEIVSTDNDFARFQALRWFNPLKGTASGSRRR